MVKGDIEWDVVGEGSQGKGGRCWLDNISVMDVGKQGGHLHNILHVVGAVGKRAGLDKVGLVVMGEGLNVD